MRDISRRIDTVEKRMRLGRHKKPSLPSVVVCGEVGRTITPEDEKKLGSHETWVTYQEQLQAQTKANSELLKDNPSQLRPIITIVLDVDKEYQARRRLKAKNRQMI